MTQKQKQLSPAEQNSIQNNTLPANSRTKAIGIVETRQRIEELKTITLSRAERNFEMSILILRKWMEVE